MKRIALVLLVVAAAAAGGWYWLQARDGAGEVRYRLAKVERGPIAAVVVASGTLNAVTTVQVGSQISGQVKEIFADFNTAVKKDQVIAQIDSSTFELRVNQARADLDSAQGAVAVARAGLAAQQAEVAAARLAQVGTGERAEKIRTYNFPQDRVTDHRVGLTKGNLPGILSGELDDFTAALEAEDKRRKLEVSAV
jgi:multidrug efflux pump subunit AcrA (membrane-fusion protein)